MDFKGKTFLEVLNTPIRRRVNKRQLSVFLRQFSALTKVGITIDEGIGLLKLQEELKTLRPILSQVHTSIVQGESLSEGFRKTRAFDDFFISMILSGEETGRLSQVTESLSGYYEKEYDISKKLKSAMTYPIILMTTSFFVLMFLFRYVLPTFISLFSESEWTLPLSTRILLAVSNFVNHNFILIFVVVGLLILGLVAVHKVDSTRYLVDKIKLKIPVIGRNNVNIITGRVSRALSIILLNGVPLIKGMEITALGLGNKYYQQAMLDTIERVKQGEGLGQSFQQGNVTPRLFNAMISLGEKTGDLGDVLEITSDYYQKETDYAIASMIAIFEPAMIIIMALIVGGIVIAIATPMFDLINNYNV